ncbi:hypothetical protein [Thalassoroseus pseudoceratinae]|uniref:hypothetical protein n=1 Tax=Thalassoroseus pseudoceratinae TaxID=2713176 RepID=UPI0014201D21|nr:hypothetical protein [Thalassoroseus pseudoceratinae]
MGDENERYPPDDRSPDEALLDLLARLIARRFLNRRAVLLRSERASGAEEPTENETSLDPEEETE